MIHLQEEEVLQFLRDSFPSSMESESLLSQIRLCNEIVREIAEHTEEPEFEDNLILEKGEVLTSLYEKMNSARSIRSVKAVHPETSIVENALFTGSTNEPSMLSELKKEILEYNRRHIGSVAGRNQYSYICPFDLHCRYNTNQIMAAYGVFTETESPEFREGVKYLESKRTDIFLINLNKSEKDFSPSTMYEDYAINDRLFHWQSQSQDRQNSAKIQRYIHHKDTGNLVSLFIREYKKTGSYTAPFTFLGNADYVRHEGEKPVSFIWKLHNPLPADLLPKANKSIVM